MGRCMRGTWILAVVLSSVPMSLSAKTYYCEMKRVQSMGGADTVTTQKTFEKSPLMYRREDTAGKNTVVMIANGNDGWLFDPNAKKGAHQRITAAQAADIVKHGRITGNDLDAFVKGGAKKSGQEKVDNDLCDIYTLSDKNGTKFTLWVITGPEKLTKKQLVEGEMKLTGERGAKDMTIKVKDLSIVTLWQFDKPMPETLFRPPANIKFKEATGTATQPSKKKKK